MAIAKEVGDRAGEGAAYGNLGNAYRSQGDYTKAIEYHTQRLAIAKEVGDRAGEGTAYANLGIAYRSLGDFSKAIEYHMQHLAIAKEVGDRAGEKGERASLREGGRKRKKREAKAGGETMHFQTGRMMSSQPQK
jgi:tetratricopeptide (TPR) repeat protein